VLRDGHIAVNAEDRHHRRPNGSGKSSWLPRPDWRAGNLPRAQSPTVRRIGASAYGAAKAADRMPPAGLTVRGF